MLHVRHHSIIFFPFKLNINSVQQLPGTTTVGTGESGRPVHVAPTTADPIVGTQPHETRVVQGSAEHTRISGLGMGNSPSATITAPPTTVSIKRRQQAATVKSAVYPAATSREPHTRAASTAIARSTAATRQAAAPTGSVVAIHSSTATVVAGRSRQTQTEAPHHVVPKHTDEGSQRGKKRAASTSPMDTPEAKRTSTSVQAVSQATFSLDACVDEHGYPFCARTTDRISRVDRYEGERMVSHSIRLPSHSSAFESHLVCLQPRHPCARCMWSYAMGPVECFSLPPSGLKALTNKPESVSTKCAKCYFERKTCTDAAEIPETYISKMNLAGLGVAVGEVQDSGDGADTRAVDERDKSTASNVNDIQTPDYDIESESISTANEISACAILLLLHFDDA